MTQRPQRHAHVGRQAACYRALARTLGALGMLVAVAGTDGEMKKDSLSRNQYTGQIWRGARTVLGGWRRLT